MAKNRREDLSARRNAPLVHVFSVTDDAGVAITLTGYSAIMQVRLYGMQSGDALIDYGTVAADLTHGLKISGSTVTLYSEHPQHVLLPGDGDNARFSYDLILTAPTGHAWIERWGFFDVKDGVTDQITILLNGSGVPLVSTAGTYLLAE